MGYEVCVITIQKRRARIENNSKEVSRLEATL